MTEDDLGKVAYLNSTAINPAWTNTAKDMMQKIADEADAVAAVVIYQTADGVVSVRGAGITQHNATRIAAAMSETATNVAEIREADRRLPKNVVVEG